MDPDLLNALLMDVERTDGLTAAHTWRVALYAQALAEAAGTIGDDVNLAMRAAVLHDVGKIDIPCEILTKPGRLTDREFAIIRTHPQLGYDRLVRLGATDPVILGVVRSHHERLDGSGYPDGLAGDRIPGSARCFSVIDTFDAMTSIRPYRRGGGPHAAGRAIRELNARAGTWYCPEAVRLLTELFEAGKLTWILKQFNDETNLHRLLSTSEPKTIIETSRRMAR